MRNAKRETRNALKRERLNEGNAVISNCKGGIQIVESGLKVAVIMPLTFSEKTQMNSFGRKAAAPRQLCPFRRTGNHQQPSSTGTL